MVKKRTTKQLPGQGPEVSEWERESGGSDNAYFTRRGKRRRCIPEGAIGHRREGVHVSQVSRYDDGSLKGIRVGGRWCCLTAM